MYDFDWSHPYCPSMFHKDTRPRNEKIKDDIILLFNKGNIRPLKGWFKIWMQLAKDISGK